MLARRTGRLLVVRAAAPGSETAPGLVAGADALCLPEGTALMTLVRKRLLVSWREQMPYVCQKEPH